ncbi:RNA polymerase sigma factor [Pedobacter hiemivivus]|uniref:Sigma-70 family RNA polymerase sigma factor n=1 Tax=Pedobacter hiemivivus TaxID=2530454 RepID=A0A4R0NFH2_9SPHI|nr:sigma-70 family RNA polymerase sigma factor [Pedobacter hiemivivus]TCC99135.1 sigma-70 family RNA polymerase sigma factor [Pedobacter hiemivivus]
MEKRNDHELVEQISKSDYKAFDELYFRHWNHLLKIAIKKIGDEDDALDVVQELFTEFWDRRGKFTIEKSVGTYLVSSLYYKIFMLFRKKGIEEKHIKNYTSFIDGVESSLPYEFAEAGAAHTEMISVVAATIDQMPEKMRAIFDLKHKQSLKIPEIAQTLGISPQTVKNQLSNAMTKLRTATQGQVPGVGTYMFLLWLSNLS